MKLAHFHFDQGLADLLLAHRGQVDVEYAFNGPQSVKHLVESLGIPHTEIGRLLANDRVIQPDYQVRDGDRIIVGDTEPLADAAVEPRFVLDGHLGRLASYLRMLGLDCLYSANADDSELASTAISDQRILVSRDRRLLMRKAITAGYLVRSLEPRVQLDEVVHRYPVRPWIRPFKRCIRCNQLLEPVPKADILDRLQPLTRRYFDEFRICTGCRQIYWKGSHYEKMRAVISDLAPGGID